jgi:hypothetical protein
MAGLVQEHDSSEQDTPTVDQRMARATERSLRTNIARRDGEMSVTTPSEFIALDS